MRAIIMDPSQHQPDCAPSWLAVATLLLTSGQSGVPNYPSLDSRRACLKLPETGPTYPSFPVQGWPSRRG